VIYLPTLLKVGDGNPDTKMPTLRQHLPAQPLNTQSQQNATTKTTQSRRGRRKNETPPENKHTRAQTKRNNKKTRREKLGESRKYHTQRLFQEWGNRRTIINTTRGRNALSIASLNPELLISREMQHDTTQQLIKHKIHIAIIQETHIPYNANHEVNGYRIINSAEIQNQKKLQKMTYQANT